MERTKVQHLRSDIINTIPPPTEIEYGEIAINYAKGSEKIFIKNSENEITEFVTKEQLIGLFYPVGSIYLTINNVNPSIIFGIGEWEQIKDTFLLAAGDTYTMGSTGGEAEHTLSIQEMPSHLHNISSTLMWANQTGNVQGGTNTYYARSDKQTTQLAGGGQPHNNMPPYLVVCIWKRIS